MREDQEAEEGAHKDPIVFYVFYVQNRDVKILIAQIFVSVKILLFGGYLIRNRMCDCHVQTQWDIKILKLSKQCGIIRCTGGIMNQGK